VSRLAGHLLPGSSASTARRAGLLVGLFLVGLLIGGFTIRRGIDPFDEGIALQAARRILEGQFPYRDFTWAYGPAEPYMLAALFKLFGVSLWQWRIVRSLADAGIALVCYLAVERRVPRAAALAVWLTVACGLAAPRTTNPYPYALLTVLITLVLLSRGPASRSTIAASGALIALAAAFRFDIALYGLSAGAVVIAARDGLRRALEYCAVGVTLGAAVYLPFAIMTGPGSLYEALVGNSVRTRAYWTLPFPLHFHPPPRTGFALSIVEGLHYYIPLASVVGLGAIVAGSLFTLWRRRPVPPLLLALVVLGAGMLFYLLSRSDVAHADPLFVVVVVGLALVSTALRWTMRVPCLAVLAVLLVAGLADRLWALANPPEATARTTLHLPVADGIIVPAQEAQAIQRLVAVVDSRVPAHEPIYVLPRYSDLVTEADPLIYVLTGRNNPTDVDFGLQTDARSQAQIVRELARLRLPLLVRWTDPISSQPEPNLRGLFSGVDMVDPWVAAHYRPLAELYHYEVLVAR
jgi:4-amino-4-deoxy-L-arabinose transferase-like glycosyltransferase